MSEARPRVRGDLVVTEIDDAAFQVKDPVRTYFYELNPIQVELIRLCDGVRTLGDIAQAASETFEVEVPEEEVAGFVEFLRQSFLLEISSYDLSDAGLARAVLARVRRRQLLGRAWAQVAHDEDGATTALGCGLAALEAGDLNPAVEQLLAATEPIATEVLHGIRAEFLAQHQDSHHADEATWSLGNPDRALGAVDRVVGRWLYRWPGLLFLGVLVAAGAHGASLLRFPAGDDLSLLDAITGFGLSVSFVLLGHECLGHGLAAKHFGGAVRDVGAGLRNYTKLIFYCDVSDAMHPRQVRRAKVIIFLGGALADCAIVSTSLALCAAFGGSHEVPKALTVAMGLGVFSIFENSLPLRSCDGHFVLASWLDVPGLALSQNASRFWRRRFGLDADGAVAVDWTPREQRIYKWYGPLELILFLGFFFGPWLFVMVPWLTSYLGVLGIILATTTTLGYVRARILPFLRVAWEVLTRRTSRTT